MSIADNMATMAAGGMDKKPMPASGASEGESQQVGHELMKTAHEREPMAKHTHVQHNEDGTHTSHHVDEEGKITGPHDHENIEALKAHMDKFLTEEGHEGGHSDDDSEDEGLM